uniref:Platelet-derived growth factor (PDGF) family profile domain-containing protein n=1 Tax=Oncorhynchus tshawytscha TaxID=74940 RepID=A0AAZ3RGK3_ONCTS
MKPFASFVIQIAVTLQLQFSPAQSTPSPSANSTTGVLMFQDVWGRSFCRTIEKLVEVVQEYPGEVEHIYSPSCVPLVRCAGCCGDENLECHPTQTSNVTMQVIGHIPSEDGCHVVRSSVYLIFVCQGKEKCFFLLFPLQLVQQRVHSQLLKIKPAEQGQEYVEMTFVEHQTCECRIRKAVVKSERRRQRGRGKKRKERQRVKDCDRCQPPRR